MQRLRSAFIAATAVLALTGFSAHAQEKLEVVHFLSGSGKQSGLKLMAKALADQNVTWVDNMVADPNTARSTAINRMLSGDPPGALQFNAGKPMQDLVDQGLLRDLDAVAAAGNWKDNLSPNLMAALSYKGHVYGLPLYTNTPVFLWYNKAVFSKLGLQEPKTWDEMFIVADKLKAAGIMPFAFAKESFTRQHLFQAVLSGSGGRDLYFKFYRDRDVSAVKSPAFLEVAKIIGKLRDNSDPGAAARTVDQAVTLMVTGKAGMMFLNDQNAKSELTGAGQVAGKDYGCVILGSQPQYVQDVQIFVMPKTNKPQIQQAQDTMAKLVGSKEIQTEVGIAWGATPARTDVDVSRLDICSGLAVKAMRDPQSSLPTNAWVGVGPDMRETLGDVLVEYWSKPSMTASEYVEKTAKGLEKFPKGT